MRQHTRKPIEVFCTYAHTDERLRKRLETHLSMMRRQGIITEWHDRKIVAGTDWKESIDLMTASVILLLISPDFLASDYCYSIQMQRALARHAEGAARVIPVLLRPVDWKDAPFAHLQCLPRDTRPVTTWSNRDAAFEDVARGIREAIAYLTTKVNVKERAQLELTSEALQKRDEMKLISGAPTQAHMLRETIPPYVSGLHSTNPSIFLNNFSQALQYQDVQNVELHTHIRHFVATCDDIVILPSSRGQREYGWKEIRELMLADKLEFEFPQYAQRNPPLSGARAHLPDRGNFYVVGMVDNKGFVLPISHFVGAVFVFTCVTCGSESTWAWKSVYICG